MRSSQLIFTPHAVQRMQQRNITKADVAIVCRYGTSTIRAGAICYFLGHRQITALGGDMAKFCEHLMGVTVLCCSQCQHTVLTVYHNQNGLKEHRHKSKYNRRESRHRCA